MKLKRLPLLISLLLSFTLFACQKTIDPSSSSIDTEETTEEDESTIYEKDEEGLRNARVVAKRMVFLMNAIKDAKTKYSELLNEEKRVSTHFIK